MTNARTSKPSYDHEIADTRIHIQNTGGTLGMEEGKKGSGLVPAKTATQLLKGLNIPERVRITLEDSPKLLDSTNVTYQDRVRMAERIASQYDDNDAFIILHGTDSIAYTCAGITMIFKKTMQKPIVVVGSQMTKTEPGTDMRNQIENAIRIAQAFSETRNKLGEVIDRGIAGVFSVASGEVFDGARLEKTHDGSFSFLDTPGRHPVASIQQSDIEIKEELVRRTDPRIKLRGVTLEKEFEPNMVTIRVTADTPAFVLTSLVQSGAIKGIILEGLGAGNVPDIKRGGQISGQNQSWIDAIQLATDAGVHVAILSPFKDGQVNLDRYALGKKAKKAGALSLGSLTPAMADAKFRQAIAKYGNDRDMIQKSLLTDLAGELSRGKQNKAEH